MKRSFHLGDVLSITTGKLVSPRHVDGIYDILNWMTQDNLFTHQLPRASRECEPWLLRQHPELRGVEAPEFRDKAHVFSWLDEQVALFGETLEIEPIPADDHTAKDPIAELQEIAAGRPIVVVNSEDLPS